LGTERKIVWDEHGRRENRWGDWNGLDCGDAGEVGKTSENVVVPGFENDVSSLSSGSAHQLFRDYNCLGPDQKERWTVK
jgi:hypothetical protein